MTLKQKTEQDVYRQGLVAHQRGNWSQAEKCYEIALECQPDWAMARYNLGVVLAQQSRLEAAAQQYEKSIALDSSYGPALENLGCVYLSQGLLDRAIDSFQRAIALTPHQASLWNNLGQAFYANRHRDSGSVQTSQDIQSTNNVQRAIDAYEQALHLQTDLLVTKLNLGILFQEQEQDRRAIAYFQAVLTQDPDHLVTHSHCAQLYLRQGQIEKAIHHWQQIAMRQAHLIEPYCDQVLQEEKGEDGEDLLQLLRYSCAQFLCCLLQRSSVLEARQWLQQTYRHLGSLLMQEAGGDTHAEYYFRQALWISPNDSMLLQNLANCLAQQQRSDAATMLYALRKAACQYLQPVGSSPKSVQMATQIAGERQPIKSDRGAAPMNQRRSFANPESKHLNHQPIPWCYASTSAWVNTTAIAPVHYQPISLHLPNSSPVSSAAKCRLKSTAPVGSPPNPLPCSVTCNPCMAELRQAFHPYQIAKNIYRCGVFDPDVAANAERINTFTVTIPNGRTWIAPHRNSWEICNSIAVITPDQTLLADVSRDYPWRLPGCRYGYRQQHQFLKSNGSLPPVERLDGRVAILSGLSGHIYYHWMIDILPRLGILTTAGWDWNDIDKFVVNSARRPFQRETLEYLGIPTCKIVESDRQPHLQADELLVPSFPGPLDWPPMATIDFLRTTFLQDLDELSPPSGLSTYPKHVYISRASASYRRLLNEEQVLDALEPFGFVAVTLENVSVKQQAKLFANARMIVAPHGAGLTNTTFCSPGTHIVELVSPHYIRTDYWIVSHHVGLNHYCVKGQGVKCTTLRQLMYQNPLSEDIWIPSDTLKSMITLLHRIIEQSLSLEGEDRNGQSSV